MMDAEHHHVPNTVGNVKEALLPVPTAGVDIPYHGICSLLDPQQLCL
jgi:hypothetical protein